MERRNGSTKGTTVAAVAVIYHAVRREYPRAWPLRLAWHLVGLLWWRGVANPVLREVDRAWHWLGRGRTTWAHWTPRPGDAAEGCNGRGTVREVSIRADKVTFASGATDSLRTCVRPAGEAR